LTKKINNVPTAKFEPFDQKQRREIASRLTDDRTNRRKRQRQLSGHVMSRWYRPPEIILQEPEYGFAADRWSIGCILAEMMNFSVNKNCA